MIFKRKKGQYTAEYRFGSAVTPNSDEMVRLGTVAVIRFLVRAAASIM